MRSHYFSIEKEKERERERGGGGGDEREGNEDARKSGRSPDQGTKLRGGRAQRPLTRIPGPPGAPDPLFGLRKFIENQMQPRKEIANLGSLKKINK